MKGSRALLFHKPKDGKDRYQSAGHGVHRAILDGKGNTINEHSASVFLGRKLIIPNVENPTQTELAPTPRDQNLDMAPQQSMEPSLPTGAALEPNVSDTVAGAAVLAGAEFENASAARGSGSGVMGGILSQEIDASSSLTNQTFVDATGTETHPSSAPFRDAANMNRGTMYS